MWGSLDVAEAPELVEDSLLLAVELRPKGGVLGRSPRRQGRYGVLQGPRGIERREIASRCDRRHVLARGQGEQVQDERRHVEDREAGHPPAGLEGGTAGEEDAGRCVGVVVVDEVVAVIRNDDHVDIGAQRLEQLFEPCVREPISFLDRRCIGPSGRTVDAEIMIECVDRVESRRGESGLVAADQYRQIVYGVASH